MSGRAVEAAGDVDTLLLDKTGTITHGNRMATELIPLAGRARRGAGRRGAARQPGRRDARGAVDRHAGRPRSSSQPPVPSRERDLRAVHGADAHERPRPRGARDPQGRGRRGRRLRARGGRRGPGRAQGRSPTGSATRGGTPLAVADGARVLGIIHLKDIVKTGIAERFARFRAMGIRTVMITGDNPRTAAAIAKEAGVDDFLAEATPEAKMRLIKDEQAKGKLVAMTGDGTNDAPALAQADVGVAMNSGTQAAKEAGNMVDLDSNPTKLLEVVEVGKQLLMTRGTLTTFSIANDVAKYFAILPAMFMGVFPEIAPLNVMHLASPSQRHPVGGHLQRHHHRPAHPAGAARGEVPAARRRRHPAPLAAHLRRGRHHRAVRRHQAHRSGAGRRFSSSEGESHHASRNHHRAARHARHAGPDRPPLSARHDRRRPGVCSATGPTAAWSATRRERWSAPS